MKNSWIIAKKELRTFFDSLVGYILLVIFLGVTGFLTWLYGNDIFYTGIADLGQFFNMAFWTLFFFIPAITMRMVAEEKRAGTLEVLLTRAVTDWEVVLGKFLGCLLMILIALAFTLPFYAGVAYLGPVDHGATLCGYLGLILLSCAYISIGIFASSITSNQIESLLLALGIGFLFHFILGFLSNATSGSLGEILNGLSTATHYESMARGVIDLRDVLYFVLITLTGLLLAETQLAKRNILA